MLFRSVDSSFRVEMPSFAATTYDLKWAVDMEIPMYNFGTRLSRYAIIRRRRIWSRSDSFNTNQNDDSRKPDDTTSTASTNADVNVPDTIRGTYKQMITCFRDSPTNLNVVFECESPEFDHVQTF